MRRASELPAQQEVLLPTQTCQVPSRQGAPVPGPCSGGNYPETTSGRLPVDTAAAFGLFLAERELFAWRRRDCNGQLCTAAGTTFGKYAFKGKRPN
eukprot:4034187-Lingulodinium_polyedra.AAC.1